MDWSRQASVPSQSKILSCDAGFMKIDQLPKASGYETQVEQVLDTTLYKDGELQFHRNCIPAGASTGRTGGGAQFTVFTGGKISNQSVASSYRTKEL